MKRLFILLAFLSLACSASAATSGVLITPVNTPEPLPTLAPEITKVCNCWRLNVRTDAGTKYPTVTVLAVGERVQLTGRHKQPAVYTWYEIASPRAGWVSGQYLCETSEAKK